MATSIRRADYFSLTVKDEPGAAYGLISQLARLGINMLAFAAVPVGPDTTQLTFFPEDAGKLVAEAKRDGLDLEGPHAALLVQGDDEIGVLAKIHADLTEAGVNVYASTGVTSGKGCFGYVVYVRSEQLEAAAKALGV